MEFKAAMQQASQYLTFSPAFIDPEKPQGLWFCDTVVEAAAIRENAVCLGLGCRWDDVVRCRPFLEAFPYLVIVTANAIARERMVAELRPRLPASCIYVVTDAGWRNCKTVEDYVALYGAAHLPDILSGAEELPAYRDWAKAKYVTLTPGDVTDNSYVYNWICAGERDHGWKVIEVDYDGHNATDLALAICGERNNEDFVVEVAQTCAGQNLAVKGFREMLLQGKIITEKNQAMIVWFANAREIKNNYDDSKLSKRFKDDSQRIDPVAATMNAMARALVKPERKPDLTDLIASGKFSM